MNNLRRKHHRAKQAKQAMNRTYGPVPMRYRGIRFPMVYWISGEPWISKESLIEFVGNAEFDSATRRCPDLVLLEKWCRVVDSEILAFSLIGSQLLFAVCRFADSLVLSRMAELLHMQQKGDLKPLLPNSKRLKAALQLFVSFSGELHEPQLREIGSQLDVSLGTVRRWRAGFELSGQLDDSTIRPRTRRYENMERYRK